MSAAAALQMIIGALDDAPIPYMLVGSSRSSRVLDAGGLRREQQELLVVEVGWVAGVLPWPDRPDGGDRQAGPDGQEPELPWGEARGPEVDLGVAPVDVL